MARGNKGLEANRLLNDPAYIEAFEAMEKRIIDALASVVLDGQPETNALVVEKVRDLQANRRLKTTLLMTDKYAEMAERQQQPTPKRVQDPRWRE